MKTSKLLLRDLGIDCCRRFRIYVDWFEYMGSLDFDGGVRLYVPDFIMKHSIYRDVFWGFVKKNGEIIEIFEVRGSRRN